MPKSNRRDAAAQLVLGRADVSVSVELDRTVSGRKDVIRAVVSRHPATMRTAVAVTEQRSYQVAVDGHHQGGFTLPVGEVVTLRSLEKYLALTLGATFVKIVNADDARVFLGEQ